MGQNSFCPTTHLPTTIHLTSSDKLQHQLQIQLQLQLLAYLELGTAQSQLVFLFFYPSVSPITLGGDNRNSISKYKVFKFLTQIFLGQKFSDIPDILLTIQYFWITSKRLAGILRFVKFSRFNSSDLLLLCLIITFARSDPLINILLN